MIVSGMPVAARELAKTALLDSVVDADARVGGDRFRGSALREESSRSRRRAT